MKKTILIILSLAFLVSCKQSEDPHKTLLNILEISQKETLTSEDYYKIVKLTEQDPEGFDKYLKEEGIIFDVKVQLMDAIYTDVFNTTNDTTALEKRLEICRWTQDNYLADSQEVKIAESRLVEIYTYWGKYELAKEQLVKNISSCEAPSLDHATCIYTKGWLEYQMKQNESALASINFALEEYEYLVKWVSELLQDETLDDEQKSFYKRGYEEALKGIEDSQNLIKAIKTNTEY